MSGGTTAGANAGTTAAETEETMDPDDERFVQQVLRAIELGENLEELGLAQDGAYQRWLIDQCALYGSLDEDDLERLETLHALYEAYTHLSTPRERLETLGIVCGLVEGGRTTSSALMPFIYMEDDLTVLSASGQALARLFEDETDTDGLGGARFVRRLVDEAEDDKQRVGLLRGLLLTGDIRIEPLLTGTWHLLGFGGQQRLAQSLGSAANPLVVEFLTDWLQSAEGPEFEFVQTALSEARGTTGRDRP